MKKWSVLGVLILLALFARAQRSYSSTSVLAEGQWLKLSISAPGVYKVTASQLKNAGISSPIFSDKLRFFGSGGAELPEGNAAKFIDDLPEVSIEVKDGGDGLFDANDYFLFYASGPHQWFFDERNHQFIFKKNNYSNKSYYFIRVSDQKGKRIVNALLFSNPTRQVSNFYEQFISEMFIKVTDLTCWIGKK